MVCFLNILEKTLAQRMSIVGVPVIESVGLKLSKQHSVKQKIWINITRNILLTDNVFLKFLKNRMINV